MVAGAYGTVVWNVSMKFALRRLAQPAAGSTMTAARIP